MRIDFRHGLRLVCHPEIVDVFHAALTAQPRLAVSLERMPAHPFLIQIHLDESWSEPTVFWIAVQMRRVVCCVKQQSRSSIGVALQVLCDVGVQVHFPFSSGGLQIFHESGRVFLDLLFDNDRTTVVREVMGSPALTPRKSSSQWQRAECTTPAPDHCFA
jgi:hypothetical protein